LGRPGERAIVSKEYGQVSVRLSHCGFLSASAASLSVSSNLYNVAVSLNAEGPLVEEEDEDHQRAISREAQKARTGKAERRSTDETFF